MTDADDSIDRSVSSLTSSRLTHARTGDDDAWQWIVARYGKLVGWWCGRSGVPAGDVDDLTQEVFAAVYKGLSNFEPGSFRGFLWRITRYKIIDYWKRQKKQPSAAGGSDIQEILNNVEAESSRSVGTVDQATKIVFDAIVSLVKAEFSDQDWRAFWAFAVEGISAADVAEVQGITRNQVYLAKSRILRRIREEFGDGPQGMEDDNS